MPNVLDYGRPDEPRPPDVGRIATLIVLGLIALLNVALMVYPPGLFCGVFVAVGGPFLAILLTATVVRKLIRRRSRVDLMAALVAVVAVTSCFALWVVLRDLHLAIE